MLLRFHYWDLSSASNINYKQPKNPEHLVFSNEYKAFKTSALVSLPLSTDSVKPNIQVDTGILGKKNTETCASFE